MSDDVDDRVRDALASLDRQAPASYFETLAARTLARLDEVPEDFVDEEVVTEDEVIGERDEHSGLQDIRELANKARLARRSSQQIPREDRIASSSAGWKAVALPDPARQAAAAHLPSHATSNAPVAASPEVVPAVSAAAVPGAVIDQLARERAARAAPVVAPRAGSKRRLVAIAGVAVAAAAGGVLVLSSHRADDAQLAPASEAVRAGTPTAATVPAPPAPTPSAPAPSGPPGDTVVVATPPVTRPDRVAANGVVEAKPVAKPMSKTVAKGKSSGKVGKMADPGQRDDPPQTGNAPGTPAKPVPAPPQKPTAQAQGSGEPSFDDLTREAGIHAAAPAPPRLDRTSLSSDDVKRGLGAVTPQARACFTGTEGTATVRLTVAPTGKVTKVTTTGPFAGTPTAACVERAVKSATFPPWDGGPQSVGYSYLLSE